MYTKFDLVSNVDRGGVGKREEYEEFTERNYKDKYGEVIERLTSKRDALRSIPYAVVTSTSALCLLRLH